MQILHDPSTLLHKTKEILGSRLIDALESPERIEAIVKTIDEDPDHELCVVDNVHDGGRELGKRVGDLLVSCIADTHEWDYVDHLRNIFRKQVKEKMVEEDGCILPECFRPPPGSTGSMANSAPSDVFAKTGWFAFDMSTGISKHSYTSIAASAALAVEGAIRMFEGQKSIVSLCRPPGHHCDTKMAGGYCYLNNAVIAVEAINRLHKAAYKRENQPLNDVPAPKIAILDIDFHHGNGTQDYFYESADVQYVSIHGEDEYPYYSGNSREVGRGAGEGFNFNHPLPTHSSAIEYIRTLNYATENIRDFEAAYLIVSLGFDTFHLDPLGSFKLETADYERIGYAIRRKLGMPCVILLEGGYVVKDLGANLVAFLKGWEGAETDALVV